LIGLEGFSFETLTFYQRNFWLDFVFIIYCFLWHNIWHDLWNS
jgi:hypothetical protein